MGSTAESVITDGRGRVKGVQADTSDALLGLLGDGWRIAIAVCLLLVTAIGLARLVGRGPTRMSNGVFITGMLIVAITVIGTLAVSCSDDVGRSAAQAP
jgi:hypothetical protein